MEKGGEKERPRERVMWRKEEGNASSWAGTSRGREGPSRARARKLQLQLPIHKIK